MTENVVISLRGAPPLSFMAVGAITPMWLHWD